MHDFTQIDEFSVFERDYPELVMYDSTGLMVQRRDFVELENIQMRELSKTTEITKNIWVKKIHLVQLLSLLFEINHLFLNRWETHKMHLYQLMILACHRLLHPILVMKKM